MYRYGQLNKSNRPDGPMDFFHNTCLVRRQNTTVGYLLFRHSTAVNPQSQSIASDGSPSTTDDLRSTDGSPATQAGLTLDGPPTGIVDPLADPVAPYLGCYSPGPDGPVLDGETFNLPQIADSDFPHWDGTGAHGGTRRGSGWSSTRPVRDDREW